MFKGYKNSLSKLKENEENLLNVLKQESKENAYTNEQLDNEIHKLTSKLKAKKMIR